MQYTSSNYRSQASLDLNIGQEINDCCDYIDIEELEQRYCTPNDLTVCFLNIRGLIGKQAILEKFLNHGIKQKKLDVIMLAETWLTTNTITNFKIAGYKFHGINRTSRKGGGTGILISDELKFKARDDLETRSDCLENCVLELETRQRNILFCALYRPPNTNIKEFQKDYNKMLKKLQRNKRLDCIVGLDHNLDLIKAEQHKPTQDFIEMTLDSKFYPTITKPTRITKTSATLIDNILLSENLIGKQNSGILQSDISDHLPCLVSLPNIRKSKREPLKIKSRNLSDKHIKKLNGKLESIDWNSMLVHEDFNSNYSSFHETLVNCIDEFCPEQEFTVPYKKIIREPWMTPGLAKCSKKQSRLYKDFLLQRTEVSEKQYKNYRITLQKVKRHSKKAYYLKKCTDFRNNTKKLWQVINKVCQKTTDKSCVIDKIKVGNIDCTSASIITNEFGKYFSEVGRNFANKIGNSNQNINDYINKIPNNQNNLFLTPCTPMEIDKIIRNLPNKTSSGHDNISNVLLKKISNSILPIMTDLFNESLQCGEFPTLMKHAEVILLFKNGARNMCTNYRPISLLLTISKVLEKLVYFRTYSFLDNTDQLYSSQYGFRAKHSCENAVMELISEITKNQTLGKHTLAIFLDLSKAFDTIQHDVLFKKMERYGIRGNSLDWYKSYLKGRTMSVKCTTSATGCIEYSENYSVEVGTAQGSCLGPLIFLIFVNDLNFHLEFCSSILFVDDTTLYKSHRNLDFLKWCIEEDLKIVSDWLRANKLTLNLGKTVYIIFPKNNKEIHYLIKMDDQPLKQVKSTKFLGMWIDSKLKWETHFNKLCVKLKHSTGLIRRGKSFLDLQSLRILYFAQFYSHLSYGINCWGTMITESQLKKL